MEGMKRDAIYQEESNQFAIKYIFNVDEKSKIRTDLIIVYCNKDGLENPFMDSRKV